MICASWKEKDWGMVARAIIELARLAATFAEKGIYGRLAAGMFRQPEGHKLPKVFIEV